MAYIDNLQDAAVQEFLELIAFDSPSWGEQAIASRLMAKLRELGTEPKIDKAGNIYAYFPGNEAQKPILLSAHTDTVEPSKGKEAVIHDNVIRSAGDAVLGADCVCGLVQILQGLRLVKDSGQKHRPVEIIFSAAEETYCEGIAKFDFSKIKSRDSYVFDLTGPVGAAARRAPSLVSWQGTVKGRAAHAGMEPEKGINAIAIMAELLTKLRQGHIDNETTCNVGIISGGQMINIVPEACTIQGEVRGYNHDKVMEQVSAIRKQLAKVSQSHAAGYEFSYNIHLHSYETEEKAPVIRRFQQVCQKLGLPGTLTETFGGSDQNPLSQHGINGIVLSNGMYKMHTTSEYTTIEDLKQGSLLAAQLILEED